MGGTRLEWRTMKKTILALLVVISMSGCSGVASSMGRLTHPRLSTEGREQQNSSESVLNEPGTDKVSPVASYGKDFDRVSGIEYDWTIHENGAVELKGKDPIKNEWVRVIAPRSGVVYTLSGHLHSVYDPTTDICEVNSSDKGRGLVCVHPMTRHFFLNHKFPETHPMVARVQ